MNKKIIKIIFFIISIFLLNNYVNAETYIDITKNVSFVDKVSNTFTYQIKQNTNNPEVLNDLENSFTIEFNDSTPVSNKVATSSYLLDFKNINFTKTGIYEFEISETSSSNEFIYPIDTNKYRVIVDVTREVDSNNTPTDNIIINVNQSAYLNDSDTKTQVDFNTIALTYITLNKKVTGDLADKNEYFKFKIEISTDKELIIQGQDNIVTYKGQNINTSNIYDPSKENYVYLKHGQSVTIGYNSDKQIPELLSGTQYIVKELNSQNYKTYINNGTTDRKEITDMIVNNPQLNTINYTNNNESIAFTGVVLRIIPFILLIAVSIVGIYLVHKNENHN